jgi:cell wall-associated NlpC family hydrolase
MRRLFGLVFGGLIIVSLLGLQTPSYANTLPITQTQTFNLTQAPMVFAQVALTRAQRIEIVVQYALAQRGDDYRFGAAGPYAFDCSGLVMASYKRIGFYLPHYSGSMLRYGYKVSRANLRRGDVIWPYYGHVQLYLGNGYVVEASSSRDAVVVRKMWGFWTARRMI